MCAYNVFFENFKFMGLLWLFKNSKSKFFYPILSRLRRFFTAYSVDIGDFLPHTQLAGNNFYRILSNRLKKKMANISPTLYTNGFFGSASLCCDFHLYFIFNRVMRPGVIFSILSINKLFFLWINCNKKLSNNFSVFKVFILKFPYECPRISGLCAHLDWSKDQMKRVHCTKYTYTSTCSVQILYVQ